MLIDTHTHLYLETFGDQTFDVIQNAINQGVGLMILPAIREEYIGAQKKLLNAFPLQSDFDSLIQSQANNPVDITEWDIPEAYFLQLSDMKDLKPKLDVVKFINEY